MAMPRKLKNMMLFNDGHSYLGVAKSCTLPPLGHFSLIRMGKLATS